MQYTLSHPERNHGVVQARGNSHRFGVRQMSGTGLTQDVVVGLYVRSLGDRGHVNAVFVRGLEREGKPGLLVE